MGMSLLDRQHSALVLIDFQAKLMPAIDQSDSVIRQALFLAEVARALGVPTLGTEQNPQGLGPNVAAVRAACDRTLGKLQFNAAADGLAAALHDLGPVKQVVMAGCEAHVCLLQSALGVLQAGFDVFVVPQACGSRRASDRALAMQRLQAAGATLVSAEMVAFEWLRACDDPQFKAVLALVKAQPVQ